MARIDIAESALHAPARIRGVEFYTDLPKTAILASRIIRDDPLPDGKSASVHLCALEFVARNGGTWTRPTDDPEGDETVTIIEGVAAGEVDEDTLRDWTTDRLT